MYEDGLGKGMSGVEPAPAAKRGSSYCIMLSCRRHRTPKECRRFHDFFLVVLCFSPRRIADTDTLYSVAAQVVQAYALTGTAEFGDGRDVVMALEAKYRLDGASRMQELRERSARQFLE